MSSYFSMSIIHMVSYNWSIQVNCLLHCTKDFYGKHLFKWERSPGNWIYKSGPGISFKSGSSYPQYFLAKNLPQDSSYLLMAGATCPEGYVYPAQGSFQTGCPIVKTNPAYDITANTFRFTVTFTTDERNSWAPCAVVYKKDDPSSIQYLTNGSSYHNPGSTTYYFYARHLKPDTVYAFKGWMRTYPPDVYGNIYTAKTGIRLWKYRAFGTKPNQEDVYGEYKYFDGFG